MRIGSRSHRDLFCRTFIDSHRPYEPEQLPWPRLDDGALALLRALPFWTIARAIEQRAGLMVTTFAQTLTDPVIREAVALQGYEETRHGRLMQHVFERYDIPAEQRAIEPGPSTKDEFVVFGFGECTDSFIGFGAFALAREKRLFPESLMAIFEHVLFEEARHIVFFVNWFRYEEARAGRDRFGERHAKALAGAVRSVQSYVDVGRTLAGTDVGDVPPYDFGPIVRDVTPVRFLEAALAEQRRHFARLDERLPKPGVMRTIAQVALIGLRALPPRQQAKAGTGPVAELRTARAS